MKLLPVLLVGLSTFYPIEALLSPRHNSLVTCYMGAWAHHREGAGKFGPDNLRPELCTHFIYAFAGLNATSWTIRSLDPQLDILQDGIGNYRKATALREKNPELKISLAIGGWNEGSKNYSDLAASPKRREIFVNSVLDFLSKYKFDGFDLDWEYPAQRGGANYDKENFVALVQDLRNAFRGKPYLLTAAIGASRWTIDAAYDIPALSKLLDYIHVMTYDYHGTWDQKVLPNAPLKDPNGASVVDSIEYLLKAGAPPSKLVLGIPMYGRTFILVTAPGPDATAAELNPMGKPCLPSGFQGPYTKEAGFMGYNEICEELVRNPKSWKTGWHEESSTSYAVKNDHVIVYDDPRSIKEKVKFAKEANLAGVMVWSVETDDTRGRCASLHADRYDPLIGNDFPLLRSINQAFNIFPPNDNTVTTARPADKINSSADKVAGYLSLLIITAIVTCNFL